MSSITEASLLAQLILAKQVHVVFAESCTAGLVSARLAMTPGISAFHCGSAVTYREETKQAWLDVSAEDLKQHTAVSEPVARQMAVGALKITPEAKWSAAVTGHLGPGAPEGLDGVVFVALAERTPEGTIDHPPVRHVLQTTERTERQEEAAALVLKSLREALQ